MCESVFLVGELGVRFLVSFLFGSSLWSVSRLQGCWFGLLSLSFRLCFFLGWVRLCFSFRFSCLAGVCLVLVGVVSLLGSCLCLVRVWSFF